MGDEIPDEAVDLLTGEPLVAHLATCHDDRPHVAPLWYDYRDGGIDIITAGKKLDNIRRNPRVALSVEQSDGADVHWGVTLRGTATLVNDDEEASEIHRRINRRYGADEDEWPENRAVRIEVGSANYWTYD